MNDMADLPVAVIGAGPVGLAAAAQLISRGLKVKVYEAGSHAGSNLLDWGHVRVSRPGAIALTLSLDGCSRAMDGQCRSSRHFPPLMRS
ncbi:hypothetical protein X773_30820 [Mesorhizobium sp. LSJC285A00]|nr:hypothetical protein X773_30820 [Mesorhizobium sp. LSJC285A00]